MPDYQTQIVRIANKIKLLLKHQEQLRKENERLKSSVSAKEQEIVTLKESLSRKDEKLAVLEAASGNMDGKARQDFEKKINQYLRDIDKVIVHLNG
jgi:predicted nuclease with TOPRIM domain